MKIPLFLLLIAAVSLAAYQDPPHSIVNASNNALAPYLVNSSCFERNEPTFENPIICAEAQLLTAYPSVDDRISADEPPGVLWRYAYASSEEEDMTTSSTNADGCTTTYYYRVSLVDSAMDANLSASFMNSTYSAEDLASNPIPLPVPKAELDKTDGSNVTLMLSGSFVFTYLKYTSITACSLVNGSCSCTTFSSADPNFKKIVPINSSLSYEVEGSSLVHFLAKPILREQWASNPEFEDFVFSKRKFYISSISINDSQVGTARLYEFEIIMDDFNASHIISLPASNFSNLTAQENAERTQPIPLEPNNDSHTYVYVFNSTRSQLGVHNITLNLTDHFGNGFSQSFQITDRILTSRNSTGEDGSTDIANSSLYRPSAIPSQPGFDLLIPSFGMFGILILLLILVKK